MNGQPFFCCFFFFVLHVTVIVALRGRLLADRFTNFVYVGNAAVLKLAVEDCTVSFTGGGGGGGGGGGPTLPTTLIVKVASLDAMPFEVERNLNDVVPATPDEANVTVPAPWLTFPSTPRLGGAVIWRLSVSPSKSPQVSASAVTEPAWTVAEVFAQLGGTLSRLNTAIAFVLCCDA